jgi:caspase domain-containing protein/tetratricopeptide repeat protein
MRVIFTLVLIFIVAGLANIEARAADQPGKVALVIGNAQYPDNDAVLNDAANDAQDLADDLKRDGFDVEKGVNLTGDAMRQALKRFYTRIQQQPGGVALIFFSGFGVQSSRQTYLLPVDAQIWVEGDVVRDGFSLESILGEMNSRGAAIKVAILDASRRNPFERRFRRYSAGLAPAVMPINTLVLYSSALGSVVTTSKNDHSIFVTELLREIRTPGVTGEEALRNTQAGVISATQGEQVPWLSSSLISPFSFRGAVQPFDDRRKDKVIDDKKVACVAPQPYPPPGSEELADDPTIKEMTRRIAANRNDQDAYFKRGRTYAIKHAYALAVHDFDEVIRLHPDGETYNNRCWTRAALGDLQGALKDCDEALRLKPGLAIALDSRGLVDLKLGRNADAIKDYSASIDKDPRSVSSLFGRGLATKQSGGDGTPDLELAKSMDANIGREFASYGVNECSP